MIHVLVPTEGETAVIRVLSDIDKLEDLGGLDWLAEEGDLGSLLTSVVAVSPETAEILRDPGQFAEK